MTTLRVKVDSTVEVIVDSADKAMPHMGVTIRQWGEIPILLAQQRDPVQQIIFERGMIEKLLPFLVRFVETGTLVDVAVTPPAEPDPPAAALPAPEPEPERESLLAAAGEEGGEE